MRQKIRQGAILVPLTFNFLAGNQEAEKNKTLMKISQNWSVFAHTTHIPQRRCLELSRTSVLAKAGTAASLSVNDWQTMKIMSACQEEAISECHSPKVNRVSGKVVSIRRCLQTHVHTREGNRCGKDPFQSSQSVNQLIEGSQQVG